MLAEELIEKIVVVRAEIRAVPPEPIAPLGCIDFPKSLRHPLLRHRAGIDTLLQEAPRLTEKVPCAVLFGFPDPDVKVAPDPGAGVERCEGLLRRMPLKIAFNRATGKPVLLRLQPAVKRAE